MSDPVPSTTDRHTEDGRCWCEMGPAVREAALDRMYPDRCQKFGSDDSPHGQRRMCTRPARHVEPCAGELQRPGGPCHFCGRLYGEAMCPGCWTSLEGMPLADLKAMFADIDLSVDVSEETP